jgi:NAD(P)-dependent dehydrogenase (short-subunit alcohol dehydrogenase family)
MSTNPLEDLVVLVTGCSTGIGRALAHELRRAGHRAYATARRKESLDELAAEGLAALRLDVNDAASIAAAVAEVIDREGRIDMLVNNAGVNFFGPLAELPLERVRTLFETNVTSLIATAQAVFPHMVERRSGRIVNVGSVVGVLPTPFAGPYCASKAAVHMMSDCLRMEVAPFGIEVIVVQPGRVRSSIADSGADDLERFRSSSSQYRAAYDGIVKRAYASQQDPSEADEFAREVVAAITAVPAPRVVRAGRGAEAIVQLAALPGEELDRAMGAQFGLASLTPKSV